MTLDRRYADGTYFRYVPTLTDSLIKHLGLRDSEVFFNRVRLYARQVRDGGCR